MKNHVPVLCLAVVLIGALTYGIWLEAEPHTCALGGLEYWSKEQKAPLFSCNEFWLNRYQSLIGNIFATVVAAGVASITIIYIVRQFKTSDRQTSAIAAQSLRNRINDLRAEAEILDDAQKAVIDLRTALFTLITPIGRFDRINLVTNSNKVSIAARNLASLTERASIDGFNDSRSMIHGAAIFLRQFVDEELCLAVDVLMHHQPNGLLSTIAEGDKELIISKALESLKIANRLDEAIRLGGQSINADLLRTWARIREFEEKAIS